MGSSGWSVKPHRTGKIGPTAAGWSTNSDPHYPPLVFGLEQIQRTSRLGRFRLDTDQILATKDCN